MIRLGRTIWYVLTLRCEEADRVRAIGRPEDLTRAERFGSWAHTQLCSSCRKARRQAEALQTLVQDLGDAPATLSEGARARILQGLEKNNDA